MKTSSLLKGACLGAAGIGSISFLNHMLTKTSISQNLLYQDESDYFHWRYGKIHYTRLGEGTPLLLIHEPAPDGSANEWLQIQYELAKKYTVYTLDLLGCGRSEKPSFSYTSYTYIQLISDFIRTIIGKPANIITSGSSAAFAILACSDHPEFVQRIIMINPCTFRDGLRIPSSTSRLRKQIIEMPILGSLIYNIAYSRTEIEKRLKSAYTDGYAGIHAEAEIRSEAAHLGGSCARFLYASQRGKYLHIPFRGPLQKTDHSLYFIGGSEFPGIHTIASEYQTENPAIEFELISNSVRYPHIENPAETTEMIQIFLD